MRRPAARRQLRLRTSRRESARRTGTRGAPDMPAQRRARPRAVGAYSLAPTSQPGAGVSAARNTRYGSTGRWGGGVALRRSKCASCLRIGNERDHAAGCLGRAAVVGAPLPPRAPLAAHAHAAGGGHGGQFASPPNKGPVAKHPERLLSRGALHAQSCVMQAQRRCACGEESGAGAALYRLRVRRRCSIC